MSAASGCPWPDIRWQAPQANLAPGPPVTALGAGGCSSGNQSGGVALPAIFAASYSLVLPGTLTMPSARIAVGCTLSGMLKVQSGSPAGTASCAWAWSLSPMKSEATIPSAMLEAFRKFRRFKADLLWRPNEALNYPGHGGSSIKGGVLERPFSAENRPFFVFTESPYLERNFRRGGYHAREISELA